MFPPQQHPEHYQSKDWGQENCKRKRREREGKHEQRREGEEGKQKEGRGGGKGGYLELDGKAGGRGAIGLWECVRPGEERKGVKKRKERDKRNEKKNQVGS